MEDRSAAVISFDASVRAHNALIWAHCTSGDAKIRYDMGGVEYERGGHEDSD